MTKTGKKRAISPVIATLILIVVAVVAGVAVYGFVTGFIAQTTSQSQAPSSIVIDAALIDVEDGNDQVQVVIRNVGAENAKMVDTIYILDAGDQSLKYSLSGFMWNPAAATSTGITPGGTATATKSGSDFIDSPTVTAGNWYIIKVITADGSSATIKVKAS
jgi:flagellin-like protein